MSFLKWLTDNRLGTHLFTRWRGERVGEDALGNVYYRRPGAADWRDERRWVVYAGDGELEASSVPAGWNAWLHKNREKAPSELPLAERFWEAARRQPVWHGRGLPAARPREARRAARPCDRRLRGLAALTGRPRATG
ncbi:MAG: NADH-ubiquinone oxidoreductase subunit NDUFA12 family protein [Geminicoccaceae bacterium]